jgi:hypothetical protein
MSEAVNRRKLRDEALDVRKARSRQQKRDDAFTARFKEADTIAKILMRKCGLSMRVAFSLTYEANPPEHMVSMRGQPPKDHELYEFVENIRNGNGGILPTTSTFAFWQTVTANWNATRSRRPEMFFSTPDGQHDWRTFQATYRLAKRRLERRAAAIYAKYKSG